MPMDEFDKAVLARVEPVVEAYLQRHRVVQLMEPDDNIGELVPRKLPLTRHEQETIKQVIMAMFADEAFHDDMNDIFDHVGLS